MNNGHHELIQESHAIRAEVRETRRKLESEKLKIRSLCMEIERLVEEIMSRGEALRTGGARGAKAQE